MVIPVGRTANTLDLTLIEKRGDGRLKKRRVLPVAFVPLKRSTARAPSG
jgi:protein-L-isoaspartate O-methyltransferase